MINKNDRKYVIPLSSAKEKHKTWKNVDKECYLVYETAKKSSMGKNDIWVEIEDDDVKHILSVMDIKKMMQDLNRATVEYALTMRAFTDENTTFEKNK